MKLSHIVKQTLKEQWLDSPLHQQLAKKAEQDKVDYKKELYSLKRDHDSFMDTHQTLQERREILNRVSNGLNLSKRKASDFEDRLKALLDEYNL
jgi:FtsZ-binding cell division protein ZapB